MLPQVRNSQANIAVADAPRPATSSPGAPDATKPPDPYREDVERTLRLFEADCRHYFRVGKCSQCARTPAYPHFLRRPTVSAVHAGAAGR